jgi:hypothetical protein
MREQAREALLLLDAARLQELLNFFTPRTDLCRFFPTP